MVRKDLLDYSEEIGKYDAHLVKILDYPDSAQMLGNTLIIVTSNNGIAMPNAKAFTLNMEYITYGHSMEGQNQARTGD